MTTPTTPTAASEPFCAEGAELIDAGYPLEAVDVLRQAAGAGVGRDRGHRPR